MRRVLEPNAQVTSRALCLLLWFYVSGIIMMVYVNGIFNDKDNVNG